MHCVTMIVISTEDPRCFRVHVMMFGPILSLTHYFAFFAGFFFGIIQFSLRSATAAAASSHHSFILFSENKNSSDEVHFLLVDSFNRCQYVYCDCSLFSMNGISTASRDVIVCTMRSHILNKLCFIVGIESVFAHRRLSVRSSFFFGQFRTLPLNSIHR